LRVVRKMVDAGSARIVLGNHERLSGKRAYEIGLVSEVVPAAGLREAAQWAASAIASAPPLAIQGTVRAIWAARELSRSQALSLGYAFIGLGTSRESIQQGQAAFAVASLLALLALVTLGIKTVLEWKQAREFEQAQRATQAESGDTIFLAQSKSE